MRITITNIEALKSAYPHLVQEVTRSVPDMKKIRNALNAGFDLPGVDVTNPVKTDEAPAFMKAK